eukprot:COSAG06_NODE_453_length_15545_cov_11.398032_4_plen_70_part_00
MFVPSLSRQNEHFSIESGERDRCSPAMAAFSAAVFSLSASSYSLQVRPGWAFECTRQNRCEHLLHSISG